MFDYVAAESKSETLDLLNKYQNKASITAGGTNLLPQIRKYSLKGRCWACQSCTYPTCPPDKVRPPEVLIGTDKVQELKEISIKDNRVFIGAGVTINDLINSETINANLPLLIEAAKVMAYKEVRNRATVGGNICNADPVADMITPLLALDATVEIVSKNNKREEQLSEIFKGNRRTYLSSNELLHQISIDLSNSSNFGYRRLATSKLGGRTIVSVAGTFRKLNNDDNCLRVSACGYGNRATVTESKGITHQSKNINIQTIVKELIGEVKPARLWGYSDEYRLEMLKALLEDVWDQCIKGVK